MLNKRGPQGVLFAARPRAGYLGVMYENGNGVPKDFVEAMLCYRKAAEQGDALAQNNLASGYEDDRGVHRDLFARVIANFDR